MITGCRTCGKLFDTTSEDAYTPDWCCKWYDRICDECYQKFKEDHK